MSAQQHETVTGPLSPDAFELGVRSLCIQFPHIPEGVVRERLRARNVPAVRVNQFLTALTVRDLLDLRRSAGTAR